MIDEDRFLMVWRKLTGQVPPATLCGEVLEAYQKPERAYHNLHHLEDALKEFDKVRHLFEMPEEAEMALWFHDAVYEARALDNEERSADWAAEQLLKSGADGAVAEHVRTLVLATRHRNVAIVPDEQRLADIDLAILGREAKVFNDYDRAIRQEYGWLGEEEYRTGRKRVLQRFLDRPQIYQTDFFRDLYELPARENLKRALAELA